MIGERDWLANQRWENSRQSISVSTLASAIIGRFVEQRVPAQVAFTLFSRVCDRRKGTDDCRI